LALDVGPGDEVIVPTLTYIASVNAIMYCGATPVFVDSNEHDWQMSPNDVSKSITKRTKAILAVHLYGQSCDMKSIMQIAKKNNLKIVEDAAEALGSSFENQKLGSYGDLATFSFYGNKTITTGEGGMVVTNNPDLHAKVVRLKGQGLAPNREYWHDIIGYNYRMTNICAAIGFAQMEHIEEVLAKKTKIANWYKQYLPKHLKYQEQMESTFHSYWMFSILVPKSEDREPLRDYLKDKGIETRPLFYPIHSMPMYEPPSSSGRGFPVACDLASRGINLPSYPDLQQNDIIEICFHIEKYLFIY
jgi:perosamine synthetase